MTERKRHGRKLLIASIGVAAVSYVACGDSSSESTGTVGGGGTATAGSSGTAGTANTGGGTNTGSGGIMIPVGNLMAIPMDSGSGSGGTIKDAAAEKPVVVGFDVLVANLIAPPPPDAKSDGNQ